MQLKSKFVVIVILFISLNQAYSEEYNILDFGAVSDTSKLSTIAIQKAIDACNTNGGGRVTIPSGKFKTGSIFLKDNVSIDLEPGATLYGSTKLKDYPRVKTPFISLRTQDSIVQLIYGKNLSNVSIGGFGEIDGQGGSFSAKEYDEGITRPHLIT